MLNKQFKLLNKQSFKFIKFQMNRSVYYFYDFISKIMKRTNQCNLDLENDKLQIYL